MYLKRVLAASVSGLLLVGGETSAAKAAPPEYYGIVAAGAWAGSQRYNSYSQPYSLDLSLSSASFCIPAALPRYEVPAVAAQAAPQVRQVCAQPKRARYYSRR